MTDKEWFVEFGAFINANPQLKPNFGNRAPSRQEMDRAFANAGCNYMKTVPRARWPEKVVQDYAKGIITQQCKDVGIVI